MFGRRSNFLFLLVYPGVFFFIRYKMKLKFLFVLLGSFVSLYGWSQTVGVDTIQIETIDILAPRLKHFSEAEKYQKIDSLTIVQYGSHDLSGLLQKVSLVNVSSNGSLGATSSVRIRGASAVHTSVNWNGIPINSLTLGSADLSLVSAGAFDDIEVVYGASGALYGSGTFGGAINLSNTANWERSSSLNLNAEYGSFTNAKIGLSGRYSNEIFSYSGQFFYKYGKNNFPYFDKYDTKTPYEKLNHNQNRDMGMIHNAHFKLNQHFIDAGLWYQVKDKNIAGIMGGGDPMSTQNQRDSSLKAYVGWKHLFKDFRIEAKLAYISDDLEYTNGALLSTISSQRLLNELNLRWYALSNLSFDVNFKYNYFKADVTAYGQITSEYEKSISIATKYTPVFGKFIVSLSQNKNSEVDPPLMYAASARIHLVPKMFDVRMKVGSHFRRPTFNERYWKPGGKSGVKHEEGWNYEMGLILLDQKIFGGLFSTDVNYYRADNDELIVWRPIKESSDWAVQNTGKILSQGFEIDSKYKLSFSKYNNIHLNIKYTYNDTYYNERGEDNYKKELAYRPHHIAKMGCQYLIKNWHGGVLGSFRSDTKTWDGELVDGNYLLDINAGYRLKLSTTEISMNGRVENVLNKSYELVRAYPMPGRAFYLGVNIKLK